jgi:hypothetical protein
MHPTGQGQQATKDTTMHDIADNTSNDSQDTEYELQAEPVKVSNEVNRPEKLGLTSTTERSVDIGPDGKRRRIVRQRIVRSTGTNRESYDGHQ